LVGDDEFEYEEDGDEYYEDEENDLDDDYGDDEGFPPGDAQIHDVDEWGVI